MSAPNCTSGMSMTTGLLTNDVCVSSTGSHADTLMMSFLVTGGHPSGSTNGSRLHSPPDLLHSLSLICT